MHSLDAYLESQGVSRQPNKYNNTHYNKTNGELSSILCTDNKKNDYMRAIIEEPDQFIKVIALLLVQSVGIDYIIFLILYFDLVLTNYSIIAIEKGSSTCRLHAAR